MRIMIVDDEVRARLSLVQVLSKRRPQHEIIGASNGLEAWERFCVQPVELIMTDVIMPIMDGLALIEAVRANPRDTALVILSAHGEFEYARCAMRHGVQEYLLKPFSEQALLDVVDRVEDERGRVSPQMDRCGGAPVPRTAREQCMPLPEGEMGRVIQITAPSGFGELERDRVARQLSARIESRESLRLVDMHGEKRSLHISLVLGPGDLAWLEQELWTLLQRIHRDHGFVLQASIGPKAAINELHLSLHGAQEIGALSFYSGQPDVFLYERCRLAQIPIESWRTALLEAIQFGGPDAICKCLSRIVSEAARGHMPPSELKKRLQEWFEAQIAEGRSLILHNRAVVLTQKMRYAAEAMEGEDYLVRVQEAYCGIHETLNALRADRSAILVEKTIDYIQRNYPDASLSLDGIAGQFHFNSAYYSNLFKRNTGMTIMQYLSHTRIDHARELLLTTHHKIYEIAAMVGFSDPRYFMRVFTRETGITPGMYRFSKRGGSSCDTFG